MATLVLTTVGGLFGPVGAAIGALAGQAVDAAIFRPAGREGPRIADLRVQTSSYGTQVPQLYGAMRVAGTVIWATDLRERADTQGGGKGRPSLTTYNYSASFAVALSSRPVRGVGRIWADGNLLRGAAGDFKSGIGAFRLQDGSADQPVDPMIAADRDAAPAHRGLAYALFEGLDLADFGNRIPSLTFEVFADEGEATVAAIAGMAEESGAAVHGYAASGGSVGEALQPLLDAHDLLVRSDGVLTAGVATDVMLGVGDDLARARGSAVAAREGERRAVEDVPRRLSLRHYDPARDYQSGVQMAERQGPGWAEAQVDLPAALDPAAAKGRAADLLRRRMLGRRTVSLARGWAALALRPGDVVALEGEGGGWRIESLEWEGMAVRLALVAVPQRAAVALPADGGAAVVQPDRPVSATRLLLIETMMLGDGLAERPQLYAAACGTSSAWRGAAVLLADGEGGYAPAGSVRRAAVMGETLEGLAAGSALQFDDASSVEIRLFDADAVLAPASDAALLASANACLIGEEMVQFGSAVATGVGTWRLAHLLRGRRGTERFGTGHAAGEAFVLLDPAALLPLTGSGPMVTVAAQGQGDATPVMATRAVDGRALLPLAPVHLRLDGTVVRWVRRSRLGWAWIDGADAPLAEETEAYRVEIVAGEALLRSVEVAGPSWTWSAMADDRAAAGEAPVRIGVRQRGIHGLGPAVMTFL